MTIDTAGLALAALNPENVDSAVSSGQGWLRANQAADGSWGSEMPRRDTAEAIAAIGESTSSIAAKAAAQGWLDSTDSVNSDFLARKILALGSPVDSTDTMTLLARQRSDGGFGLSAAYGSDAFDTALSLRALAKAGVGQSIADKAAAYLLGNQNADSGWSMVAGAESSLQTTAEAVLALDSYSEAYQTTNTDVDGRLVNAADFLASRQNQDGSIGAPTSVTTTAIVAQALAVVGGHTGEYEAAISFLVVEQASTGGWRGSAYQTAAALQALQAKSAGIPDLGIAANDILATPTEVASGDTVTVSAVVRNLGSQPSPATTVAFYLGEPSLGGTKLAERNLNSLLPGEAGEVKYALSTVGMAGSYRLFVVVESSNTVPDADLNNNAASIGINVGNVPSTPTPMSPVDGAIFPGGDVSFSWLNAEDVSALPLTYELQIDSTAAFTSPEKLSFFVPEEPLMTEITLPSRLSDGVWYWRLAGGNGFATGSFSSSRSFTVATLPLRITGAAAVPNTFSPADWVVGSAIVYDLSAEAAVDVTINDQSGRLIRHLGAVTGQPGSNSIIWDGRQDTLAFAPDGTYEAVIHGVSGAGAEATAMIPITLDSKAPDFGDVTAAPEEFSPNGDGDADQAWVTYDLSEPALVTAKVYKGTQMVRHLEEAVQRPAGPYGVMWDGKDSSGEYARAGTYHIVLSAADVAGNQAVEKNVAVELVKDLPAVTSVSASPNPALPGEDVLVAVAVTGKVATARLELDSKVYDLAGAANDGVFTTTIKAATALGLYPLTVTAIGPQGDVVEDASANLRVKDPAVVTKSWMQTSQADFYTGIRSNLDLNESPGDITIGLEPWENRAPLPVPAAAFGTVSVGGKIYVAGGIGGFLLFLNKLQIYDPTTDKWALGPPMPTAREKLGAAVGEDGKIYVFGGIGRDGYLDNVEAFDPATGQWERRAPMPFPEACYATQLGSDGKIYLMGGHWQPPSLGSYDDTDTVLAYDTVADSWQTVGRMSSARAEMGSGRLPDGSFVVAGGDTGGDGLSPLSLAIAERYDPVAEEWQRLPDLKYPRNWPGVAVTQTGDVFAIGGAAGGDNSWELNSVEVLAAGSSTWNKSTPMNLERALLGAATDESGNIYAIGGVRGLPLQELYTSKVESYNPAEKYYASGELTSAVEDIGRLASWEAIEWTASQPTSTSVELQTRSSVDGSTWSDWSKSYAANGSKISSPPGRYIQYKAVLATADHLVTPKLSDVTIKYNSAPGRPAALAPAGESVNTGKPTLIWKNADDLEGDRLLYTVQLDSTSTFDSSELKTFGGVAEGTKNSSFSTPDGSRLSHGSTWYWRARATDGSSIGQWSVAKKMTVDALPPVLSNVIGWPEPFSPQVNGKRDTTTLTFDLSEDANATVSIQAPGGNTVKTVNFFGKMTHTWRPEQSLSQGRIDSKALALPGGRVLVMGGVDYSGQA